MVYKFTEIRCEARELVGEINCDLKPYEEGLIFASISHLHEIAWRDAERFLTPEKSRVHPLAQYKPRSLRRGDRIPGPHSTPVRVRGAAVVPEPGSRESRPNLRGRTFGGR